MQKYMCNVCGKLHDLFNDAALCHPDVVIKEFPDLPVRDAQLRIGADDAGHDCPLCNGTGFKPISPTCLAECKHDGPVQS